jgi:hypothetical protein
VLHPPSPAGLFIYSSRGKCPPLLSSGAFFMIATVTSFPAPKLLGRCCHSCLLWPTCLFTIPFWTTPLPTLVLRAPCPLCSVSFFVVVVYYSVWFFSLFSLGGGWSVQGTMLIWLRVVCGSTACCLAHLVVCFSRAGRSWSLVAQEPSWFLRLTWSGDAMCRLGVWRCWSFASSWWFFLQGVSPASLQDFTLGSMLSASSL